MGRMVSSGSMIWVDVSGKEHQRCPICKKYVPAGKPYKRHVIECRARYLETMSADSARDAGFLDDAFLGI